MPQISVIVPVYKVEPYLRRCVDSILAQTFTDFELILVDDGSPDNCPAICDAYAEIDPRIHVIHQDNGGLSAARNAGIDWVFKRSISSYISFIDSDDYVHPKMFEYLYRAINEHNVDVSICEYAETHGEAFNEIQEYSASSWKTTDFYFQRKTNFVVAWGKLYKRNCFDEIRYPLGKYHEDEFTTHRILFEYEFVAVVECQLYGYFQNSSGIMRNTSVYSQRVLHKVEAFEAQYDYFKQNEKIDLCILAQSFFLASCHVLKKLHENNANKEHIRLARARTRKLYRKIKNNLNRYDRVYMYFLRYGGVEKWLIKNDFEPIQNYIRTIRKNLKKVFE